MSRAEELRQEWQVRLETDYPDQPLATQNGIIRWLIGEDEQRFDDLPPAQLLVLQQAMDYRYRILQQRYLNVPQDTAYRSLLKRLASLSLIRSKIRTWVSLSRDRQRTVMDVLQEVIQELIQSDRYIRQQIDWIAECTPNPRLRNALLLTSIEEYCLRPIRNQPLIIYRFVNYLRRSHRGGMTQVPGGDLVRLVSEEITSDDTDGSLSLLDLQAQADYQEQQAWAEQQTARQTVMQEFLTYLADKVDPMAAQWLELHVKGKSQEAIAKELDVPIKQVYRLREKISYHAKNVFASKIQPEVVTAWLGTSAEHNFGMSAQQWQQFEAQLTPEQRQLVDDLKAGKTTEAIAQERNLKVNQVKNECSKLYLEAYEWRNASPSGSTSLETSS
ncbi:HetZ-related protein 2 [Leptolyngbya sp. AN02str]|uniref:HetZ-related protein 2 n=1 Tax=Leptolyngbya sp. AN02str TaxID=3423363 RepID=UPI003D319EA9